MMCPMKTEAQKERVKHIISVVTEGEIKRLFQVGKQAIRKAKRDGQFSASWIPGLRAAYIKAAIDKDPKLAWDPEWEELIFTTKAFDLHEGQRKQNGARLPNTPLNRASTRPEVGPAASGIFHD